MNIGSNVLKKDQYETWIMVKDEEYQNHQSRKEKAWIEKESAKKKTKESSNTAVIAVDVQKMLTCSDKRASSS